MSAHAVRLMATAVTCLLVLFLWVSWEYQRAINSPLNLSEDATIFSLESGQNLQQVTRALSEQGILTEPRYFIWHARWRGEAHRLQAGEYTINAGMTPARLLEQFVRGDVRQYALTVFEGWTFKQLMAAVNGSPHLLHTLRDLSPPEVMERLGLPDTHPEGQFLPDTYLFPAGTRDVDFLQRTHRLLQAHLQAAWETRDLGLPLKTPYEALVLASIVEKETGIVDERPQVAGVFIRRLQQRMRLEADPTVIYGMGDSFDGDIRRGDLRRATPYNTYVIRGLPPTPIAMPGRAAIDATLHPASGDALFFVATGHGGHVFSRTLAEHRAAVTQYQRTMRRKSRERAQQKNSER